MYQKINKLLEKKVLKFESISSNNELHQGNCFNSIIDSWHCKLFDKITNSSLMVVPLVHSRELVDHCELVTMAELHTKNNNKHWGMVHTEFRSMEADNNIMLHITINDLLP